MKTRLRKYVAAFFLAVQSALEYRVNFIVGLFSGVFVVIIQFFMWTAIYEGDTQGELFGYTYSQMVVYVVMAGILSKATGTGFEWEIASDIKDGGLSRFLVQPISYLPYRLMSFFGTKVVQLAFIGTIGVIAFLVIHCTTGFAFEIYDIGYLLIAIVFGILLNCILFYCLSAFAFWLTEVYGVFLSLMVVSSVLSGGIFPLEVFGEVAMKMMSYLPFQYIIYFPLRILTGELPGSEILLGLLVQLFWILFFYLVSKILWRKGLRKYIAAGG